MHILLIEPFFTGSHQQWALDYQRNSRHHIDLLPLEGRHWKWRMHGAAVTLAAQFNAGNLAPDLILATDMLDLTAFLALTRKRTAHLPTTLYFHENQLTYPWSATDADVTLQRDVHYAFINYTAALAADAVFFNSDYHRTSFLNALPEMLKRFPDHQELANVERIRQRSEVLHLGLDLTALDTMRPKHIPEYNDAVILWNHRWEYDKNPDEFFRALFHIHDSGIGFHLIVLGENFRNAPPIFEEAKEKLADLILHWGFARSRQEYVQWLWTADLLPVTSRQDFFGASVVEAMYCNVRPLLPDRLAYPEHIPASEHPAFFYEDGEFANRLQEAVIDVRKLRQLQARGHVSQYDWKQIAAQYDSRFEALAAY